MSAQTNQSKAGRLFVLDASGGRVLSMNTDGSDKNVIATGCRGPDGVAVPPMALAGAGFAIRAGKLEDWSRRGSVGHRHRVGSRDGLTFVTVRREQE